MKKITAELSWPGREQLSLALEVDELGRILSSQLRGIGPSPFLAKIKKYREQLKGFVVDLPVWTGQKPEDMALREVVLRIQGLWRPPYQEEEICHCRMIETAKVDLSICMGAHTMRKIQEATSASTACGTCRADVEALLKYRLGYSGASGNAIK